MYYDALMSTTLLFAGPILYCNIQFHTHLYSMDIIKKIVFTYNNNVDMVLEYPRKTSVK